MSGTSQITPIAVSDLHLPRDIEAPMKSGIASRGGDRRRLDSLEEIQLAHQYLSTLGAERFPTQLAYFEKILAAQKTPTPEESRDVTPQTNPWATESRGCAIAVLGRGGSYTAYYDGLRAGTIPGNAIIPIGFFGDGVQIAVVGLVQGNRVCAHRSTGNQTCADIGSEGQFSLYFRAEECRSTRR